MPEKKKRLTKTESRVRAIKALQLKMAGYSYQHIADQLGFANKSGALKAVKRILDGYENELSVQYRAMENQRLEELQAVWWTKALYPGHGFDQHGEQLDATKAVLAIMKQRADLLGLNIDPRIEVKERQEERYNIIWDVKILQVNLEGPPSRPAISSTSSPSSGKPPKQ